MKTGRKILIVLALVLVITPIAKAESLFMLNASQSAYAEPKPLYGSIKARTIGDLLTIIMNERVTMQDNLSYTAGRTSSTNDNFSGLINAVFKKNVVKPEVNNFGGANTVESKTQNNRAMNFQDRVAVQVVQVLPNGNLLVQGKKTFISSNERMDMLVSGVVNPNWINDIGEIDSKNVANLQFAMNGKGSVSRSGGEGVVNRVIRYLF